ncbi:hypothetical protein [Streptosporangium roseum]|uniref:hypothetical protein n=1 Tax=Streptosporangium roseum TaxID=2001 RepID=UPI00332D8C39
MMTSLDAETTTYDGARQRIVSCVIEFVEGITVVKMSGQAKRRLPPLIPMTTDDRRGTAWLATGDTFEGENPPTW